MCDRASQFLIQRESQPFKDNYDVTVKEELKDQFKKIEKKIKKKAEEAEKVQLSYFVMAKYYVIILGNFGGKVKS